MNTDVHSRIMLVIGEPVSQIDCRSAFTDDETPLG